MPPLPRHAGPHTLLHAHLATENLCTENLTPFLKLLPTKGLSGLSALMRPHALLSHAWHTMGVDVVLAGDGTRRTETEEGTECRVTMWWEAVVDPIDWKGTEKRGGPGRWDPGESRANRWLPADFPISSIFHQVLPRPSPLAESSTIKLIKPTTGSRLLESVPANMTAQSADGSADEAVWQFDAALAGKDLTFRWDEISFEHRASMLSARSPGRLTISRPRSANHPTTTNLPDPGSHGHHADGGRLQDDH